MAAWSIDMLMKTMVFLQSTTDDEFIKELNEKLPQNTPEKYSSVDNLLQLLGLVILLAVILLAAFYTSKFIGKMKLGQLKNSNFDVVDTYKVSPGKTLQIVKVGKKYIVISIAKDNISFITDLAETDLVFKDHVPVEKKSFRQIIDSMRNNKE